MYFLTCIENKNIVASINVIYSLITKKCNNFCLMLWDEELWTFVLFTFGLMFST